MQRSPPVQGKWSLTRLLTLFGMPRLTLMAVAAEVELRVPGAVEVGVAAVAGGAPVDRGLLCRRELLVQSKIGMLMTLPTRLLRLHETLLPVSVCIQWNG